MDRRSFLQRSIFSGAALVPYRESGLGDVAENKHPGFQMSTSDRDPVAIQDSTLIVNGLDPSELTTRYVEMLRSAGVSCWLRSRTAPDVQAFADAHNFLDAHRDRIVMTTTVKEIYEARRSGRIAHIFGWQSANVLGDAKGEPPPTALRAYYQLGLRVVGIAYNVSNIFGAGCLEPHLGLTRAGQRLVEEIHHLRILLDVGGHTGEQTSLEAIKMSSGVPIVCTHTNVAALIDNPRNSTDRLFEAIANTGGVIGVTAFNDFHARTRHDTKTAITPQVDLEKHLDHFDYLRRLVGTDHIGLGPDFIEGRDPNAAVNPEVAPPEVYSRKPWLYVKGFERITELPNITRGLIERGWSTKEIKKVLGENWLRVYEQVWGS